MTANRYLFKGNDWTGILLWIRTHVCAWYEGLDWWVLQGNMGGQRYVF